MLSQPFIEVLEDTGRSDMDIDDVLTAYREGRSVALADLAKILEHPSARQSLYKTLIDQPLLPFRELLLYTLDLEMAFRQRLWNRTAIDPENHYEGIYRCAFLLYRIGNPADTLRLWSAKHINMDVGSSMGAEYFLGAGVDRTRAFLDGSNDTSAADIHDYIDEFLSYENGEWSSREEWEHEQSESIRHA